MSCQYGIAQGRDLEKYLKDGLAERIAMHQPAMSMMERVTICAHLPHVPEVMEVCLCIWTVASFMKDLKMLRLLVSVQTWRARTHGSSGMGDLRHERTHTPSICL